MAVAQLSVFLNNEVGRLAEATRVLGAGGVNVVGFAVAETVDFGIVRLIVDNTQRAVELLRGSRFTVQETPVVVARVADEPGGLAHVLDAFSEAGVNVDYSYAIVRCVLAFGVEDVASAETALTSLGVSLLSRSDVCAHAPAAGPAGEGCDTCW